MFGHYVDEVLQPGERVLYRASLHWIIYWQGALLWAFAAALYLATSNGFLHFTALVGFAVGLLLILRSWFRWWITEVAVTDRRVIYKRGFIARTTAEMHMDKIESVRIDQSVLGRILDYGHVTVVGTGTGTEPLGEIDQEIGAPLELRNHITGV
jgi:uncharacterized membrane protein YdbT with pleckstrin-like domain